MQDTPFSEFDVKKKNAQAEKISFIAFLHKIPKQVADSAQTQGVSEKFLEKGMPSGILTPSQISHDRMLSVTDAFQDAIFIGLLLAFLPLFEFGLWTSIFVLLFSLYWFFHIAWWEKGKAWDIKGSVKRYLVQTYNFYWVIFSIAMLIVSFLAWWMIFSIGAHLVAIQLANDGLQSLSGAERSFAGVFKESGLNERANYIMTIKGEQYQTRFVIIFSAFLALTIGAKVYFKNLYLLERDKNVQNSEEELDYSAESALRKLGGY